MGRGRSGTKLRDLMSRPFSMPPSPLPGPSSPHLIFLGGWVGEEKKRKESEVQFKFSLSHRIRESHNLSFERDFRSHLLQPICTRTGNPLSNTIYKWPANLCLKASCNGELTIPPNTLLAHLTPRKLSLISFCTISSSC